MRPEVMLQVAVVVFIFWSDVGQCSEPLTAEEEAREVWKSLQYDVCNGFDDVTDVKMREKHALSCVSYGLDNDFTRMFNISNNKKSNKMRILYLTTINELFLSIERDFVNEYTSVCQSEGVESEMWGIGFQGFNVLESVDDNVNRWFVDNTFDVVHVSYHFYRAMSYIMHNTNGVDLNNDPFMRSNSSLLSRSTELVSIGTDPVLSINLDELGDRDIEDISVLRPHVIGIRYEQHLGVGYRAAGLRAEGKKNVYNKCGEPDPEDCPMNPKLQEYLRHNFHTLLLHKPHCINSKVIKAFRKTKNWRIEDDVESDVRSGGVDLNHEFSHQALLFGSILHVYYPLRTTCKYPFHCHPNFLFL